MSIPAKIYLYRRTNGWYYVGYFESGRKRWKSTRQRSKREALRAVANFTELFKPKPVVTSLAAFCERFLAYVRATLGLETLVLYERTLRHFQVIAGDVELHSLTSQHFDRYKVARLEGRSPVSVNMELRALKAAFRTAVRWKLLQTSPFAEARQVAVPEALPLFFSKADFARLLEAVPDGWLREIIVFAALTGMRQGEIRNLRWQDVDLQRGLIRVQSSPSFRVKAGKVRVVPVNRTVAALLQGKARQSSSGLVFTFRGRLIARNHLTHAFKVAVRAAKLDEGLHFHSLRHTFASWLAQDGVSLYAIQKLLGHSSANVTQIYSHLQPDQMHDTVNRLAITMN
jgi:integrase